MLRELLLNRGLPTSMFVAVAIVFFHAYVRGASKLWPSTISAIAGHAKGGRANRQPGRIGSLHWCPVRVGK
jgi:hypothetical protein